MNYFEEINLPVFDKDIFFKELIKLHPLMKDRTFLAKGWKSIDLIKEFEDERILITCPTVLEWLSNQKYKTVYIALLEPYGYIDWHLDQQKEQMSKAINLYVKTTNKSYIEFIDGFRWYPKAGKAYKFRADIKHRVKNSTKEVRMVMNLW